MFCRAFHSLSDIMGGVVGREVLLKNFMRSRLGGCVLIRSNQEPSSFVMVLSLEFALVDFVLALFSVVFGFFEPTISVSSIFIKRLKKPARGFELIKKMYRIKNHN